MQQRRRRRFEVDLRQLDDRYVDDDYARELYAALCNNEWVGKYDSEERYSCSSRYAGQLVAFLRAMGEDYGTFFLDFDSSAEDAGRVSERVREDLDQLGWRHERLRKA